MTHTTEQERAEFEKAWRERPIYMGGVHQKEVAYIWWMQAARRAPAVPVPQGWKPVPVELLERIQESLSSFVSDQGWSQSDMDTADALDGLLAAHGIKEQST